MNENVLTFEEIHAMHQAGDIAAAKIAYLKFLHAHPDHADAHHMLSVLYVQQREFPLAKTHLKSALTLNPNNLQYQLHLSNVYKATEEYELAEELLLHIIDLHPTFSAAHNNLGTVYYLQGKWLAAKTEFAAALTVQSNYIDAYYNSGLVCIQLRQKEEASHSFKAVLELAPDHPGAHFQLARLLMEESQYERAITHLNEIAAQHPFHVETQTNLGSAYFKLGRLKEAEVHYLNASNIKNDDTQVLFNLAIIYSLLGKVLESMEYYQRVFAYDNNDFPAHNNLAIIYLDQKNISKALYHFKECLRIQPQNIAIQHHIAILENKNADNPPAEYLQNLFDGYADNYDQHLKNILQYQVPTIFFKMLSAEEIFANIALKILDLGCGTGISGEPFKHFPSVELIGVDISEKMLAKAKTKNIYTQLVQEDILQFTQKYQQHFDIILAADTLVYVGNLRPIFTAIAHALILDGYFIFNTEQGEADYALDTTGRFTHQLSTMVESLEQLGFAIVKQEVVTLRKQDDKDVKGQVILAKKIRKV